MSGVGSSQHGETGDERGDDEAAAPRTTRQRRAVVDALDGTDGFLSARAIHAHLDDEETPVGLATVYRTLQALADAGEVDVLQHGAEAVYRRCSTTHHHHLVCRECGRTVEIEGPAVERWSLAVARDHDFVDVSHTLELFGVCTPCQAAAG